MVKPVERGGVWRRKPARGSAGMGSRAPVMGVNWSPSSTGLLLRRQTHQLENNKGRTVANCLGKTTNALSSWERKHQVTGNNGEETWQMVLPKEEAGGSDPLVP